MSTINSQSPNTITTPDGTELTKSTTAQGSIVSDGTNDRVVIGYLKDGFGTGNNFGIKVSQEGYDVKTASDEELVMSSTFNNLKVFATGSVTLTTSGASPRQATATITHNLGYSPLVVGSVLLPSGYSDEIIGFPSDYTGWTVGAGGSGDTFASFSYFAANLNSLQITVTEKFQAGNYVVKYYILVETSR